MCRRAHNLGEEGVTAVRHPAHSFRKARCDEVRGARMARDKGGHPPLVRLRYPDPPRWAK